jgi:hypothetical protein
MRSVINSKYLIGAPSYFGWQCQPDDKSPIHIYNVPTGVKVLRKFYFSESFLRQKPVMHEREKILHIFYCY